MSQFRNGVADAVAYHVLPDQREPATAPRVRRLVADLIREAASASGATVEAELDARTLLALADGLTVQVLLGQLERDEARQTLGAHVQKLCRTAGTSEPQA